MNRPDRLAEAHTHSASGDDGPAPMSAADRKALIADLVALIAAIEQRVPHIERVGEARIARDAAELKARAVARVDSLRAEQG